MAYDIQDAFLIESSRFIRGVVYDLGAGESPYRKFVLGLAHDYVAVDWPESLHKLDVAISADLNLPLPVLDGLADCVLSIQVLEHLHRPDVMLSESFRILKPGGTLLMTVPWQWPVHEAPHDYFRYTPYALKLMLENAGFTDVRIKPSSGFFTTMCMKCNYFSLRLIRGPRLLRRAIRLILWFFWAIGQRLAPVADKLDTNWELEASWYFVVARKP